MRKSKDISRHMLILLPAMPIKFSRKWYGVATISRLLKIMGLFCRISSLLYGSFAKETYDFKEPTNRSRPIQCIDKGKTSVRCRQVFCKAVIFF